MCKTDVNIFSDMELLMFKISEAPCVYVEN